MKGYQWLDVLASSDLKGATKAVGYALAHFAGANGAAWPSYDTLARAAGVSRKTAIEAISTLSERGFINIVQRSKADGTANSNLYLLTSIHKELVDLEQQSQGQVVKLGDHLVTSLHHPERGGSHLTTPKQLLKEPLVANSGIDGVIRAQAQRWRL